MYSFSRTDGWYDGRPVAAGSTPSKLISARSSASTNASITRTGLLSSMKSSRHSGNSVHCPRSASSTKRLINSPQNHGGIITPALRFHTARVICRHSASLSGCPLYPLKADITGFMSTRPSQINSRLVKHRTLQPRCGSVAVGRKENLLRRYRCQSNGAALDSVHPSESNGWEETHGQARQRHRPLDG